MIIEIKPPRFTKKYCSWIELRFKQQLHDELYKKELQLYRILINNKNNWLDNKFVSDND